MFDVIKDNFNSPASAFSLLPVFAVKSGTAEDKIVKALTDFKKSGVDAFILKAECGDVEFAEALCTVLKTAKELSMKFYIALDLMRKPPEDGYPMYGVYAKPGTETVSESEYVMYKIYAKIDNGLCADVSVSGGEGYAEYNVVFGPSGLGSGDILSAEYVEENIIGSMRSAYSVAPDAFGDTVTGFYLLAPTELILFDGYVVPWSDGIDEVFCDAGGDMYSLSALFFEMKEKKKRREALHLYGEALRKRLEMTVYAPLEEWCREHNVAFAGATVTANDTVGADYFTYPAAPLDISEKNLIGECGIKLVADISRHHKRGRSITEIKNSGEKCTPDSLMTAVNTAFLSCSSSIVLNDVKRNDYKSLSGYVKRMSFIAASDKFVPEAAVLCSSEYLPTTPVEGLNKGGFSYTYLSLYDFMRNAGLSGGEILIENYSYKILLVDGRLRLDADTADKIEFFKAHGGHVFRGSDFAGYMKQKTEGNARFAPNAGIRITAHLKNGFPFYVLYNEGEEKVSGEFMCDMDGRAYKFDPMSGNVCELTGEKNDGGYGYLISLGSHETCVIGINTDEEALVGDREKDAVELLEITALSDGRKEFEFIPDVGRHAYLLMGESGETKEIYVNGRKAGDFVYRPYEVDISNYLHKGMNTVEVLPAENVPELTVRIYGRKNPIIDRNAENGEVWDTYDINRNKTGRTARRGEKLLEGDYHIVVHVWTIDSKGRYLLTKRHPDKMFPLMWECTGGSALTGEDSVTAAIREVMEETGIILSPEEGEIIHRKNGSDYFGDIWLFRHDYNLDDVKLQEGETVDARAETEEGIRALIEKGEFAPYDYLDELFNH